METEGDRQCFRVREGVCECLCVCVWEGRWEGVRERQVGSVKRRIQHISTIPLRQIIIFCSPLDLVYSPGLFQIAPLAATPPSVLGTKTVRKQNM